MSAVIHEDQRSGIDLRMLLFPITVLSVLGAFCFRLWYLQVVDADALVEKALRMRSASISNLAPRGLIVDRNGKLLAGVRSQLVITAVPSVALKDPKTLEKVAEILNVSADDLRRETEKGSWRSGVPTPIYSKATVVQATRILEATDLPGITVNDQPLRFYPDTSHFSHILGYVGVPYEADVKRLTEQKIEPADYVGKIGLEKAHEKDLMGKPGVDEVVMDAIDKPLRLVSTKEAEPGAKLILGVDAELQTLAYNLLNGREGSVVALDPKTFEVLCLVNYPTYDVAPFMRGISQSEYDQLLENPAKPMINRAIYMPTAPGSTFKIVTTIAAMKAGIDVNNFTAYCSGGIKVGNRFVKCLGHHGSIGFDRALAKSCNAYFIALGMRAKESQLREACHLTGIGERTGVDITGEQKGVNPTRDWIISVNRDKKYVWYPGDTANFSIGQGYVSATPIQMATMIATVANDGVRLKPHALRAKQIRNPETGVVKTFPIQPEVVDSIGGSPAFWSRLKNVLGSVMSSGTGAGAGTIPGLKWGGKTGSAERKGQARTDSWFVGFAPLDNPKIAICVRVAGAGHGSEAAVPIAREIVAKYLKMGNYKEAQSVPAPSSANKPTNSPSARPASSAPPASPAR